MFALIATILIALFACGVNTGPVHLGWLGSAFLAAHHVVGEWSPWRR